METSWIKHMTAQLDPEQLNHFLHMAHHSLQTEFNALIEMLDTNQYDQALKQAHLMKSTASLINSEPLLVKLKAIETNKLLLKDSSFRQSLVADYQHSLQGLENLLPK